MPCYPFRSGGATGMICTGRSRTRKCRFCGGPAGLLCDFPLGGTKSCDKPICRKCAIAGGTNVDFCPDHPVPVQTQLFAAD